MNDTERFRSQLSRLLDLHSDSIEASSTANACRTKREYDKAFEAQVKFDEARGKFEQEFFHGGDTSSPVTHLEIHAGVLKCECGEETLLADSSSGGKLMNNLVAYPENACPSCKVVWCTPATVDLDRSTTD